MQSIRACVLLPAIVLGTTFCYPGASGCSKQQQVEPAGATRPAPKEGKIKVALSSRPGQWNLEERERGYRETFAKHYPQIDVIQTVDDETKYSVGAQRAAAVIAAHPEIAGFAGLNAASGPGIARAVREADRVGDIVIVAMDADSSVLDAIAQGVITASVAQRQYFMTYIGVKYLYGLNHGYYRRPGDASKPNLSEIPKELDTGTVEVSAANVATFRTPSQGAKEELLEKHPDWVKMLSDRKQGEASADEEYVMIGISMGVEYWNATRAGLTDVCEELGVKATVDGPQGHEPEQQATILDKVIARRPAGILIAPGNPDTLLPYINKAVDEGIPVICIDTDSPKSRRISYFGTSNYNAGVMGARILSESLLAKRR